MALVNENTIAIYPSGVPSFLFQWLVDPSGREQLLFFKFLSAKTVRAYGRINLVSVINIFFYLSFFFGGGGGEKKQVTGICNGLCFVCPTFLSSYFRQPKKTIWVSTFLTGMVALKF